MCRLDAAMCWAFMETHVVCTVRLPTWKAVQYQGGIAISYVEIVMLSNSKSYVDLTETYVVSPACLPTWKTLYNTYEVLSSRWLCRGPTRSFLFAFLRGRQQYLRGVAISYEEVLLM